ncbi:hypothetical protein [Rhizobium leguminosarum]|uniref:hypothetical protein n=1 Tax=Rhizobium leguminosarum TaxID=384 RepID=UPI0004824335|nr:hypothetical protein [Rhizobium leguminosarum]
MNVFETASPRILLDALKASWAVGDVRVTLSKEGLNAPLVDEVANWIERIWEKVDGAVHRIEAAGRDAAQPIIDDALELYRLAREDLKDGVEAVRNALLERINVFMSKAVDLILQSMKPELLFGNRTLHVASVAVGRTVTLGTSFELSLEKMLSFSADGELSINVQYEFGKP